MIWLQDSENIITPKKAMASARGRFRSLAEREQHISIIICENSDLCHAVNHVFDEAKGCSPDLLGFALATELGNSAGLGLNPPYANTPLSVCKYRIPLIYNLVSEAEKRRRVFTGL
jgi:hypothetical protein